MERIRKKRWRIKCACIWKKRERSQKWIGKKGRHSTTSTCGLSSRNASKFNESKKKLSNNRSFSSTLFSHSLSLLFRALLFAASFHTSPSRKRHTWIYSICHLSSFPLLIHSFAAFFLLFNSESCFSFISHSLSLVFCQTICFPFLREFSFGIARFRFCHLRKMFTVEKWKMSSSTSDRVRSRTSEWDTKWEKMKQKLLALYLHMLFCCEWSKFKMEYFVYRRRRRRRWCRRLEYVFHCDNLDFFYIFRLFFSAFFPLLVVHFRFHIQY